MANVDLGTADLALLSDPVGTLVTIPYLTAFAPQMSPAVALVRFEGDQYPTAFRGEGLSRTLSLSATFSRRQHEDALALEQLLLYAHTQAADGRLQLRTHTGLVDGLDPLEVFVVTSWSHVPHAGLYRVVNMNAVRVAYTLEV
jgi:hypothetical protein